MSKPKPEVWKTLQRFTQRAREILDAARTNAARSVNTEMVEAHWRVGEAIVEREQKIKMAINYLAHEDEAIAVELLTENTGKEQPGLFYLAIRYLKPQNFKDNGS